MTLSVAGIDEAGRGCLCGAVIAASVILKPGQLIDGLADSKMLTPGRREVLAAEIKEKAFDWAIGRAEASEIDRYNILQASMLAMQRAFEGLSVLPDIVKVDGNRVPELSCPTEAIVGGDRLVNEISAASILAKVARDSEMKILDGLFPGYEFSKHKGYPTKMHKQRLLVHGVTVLHRTSYRPVRDVMIDEGS
ncbi:MAG: ribonuclease HII [Methylococcales bacterium]